jgi:uncharacterized protein (TIGR00156 family)
MFDKKRFSRFALALFLAAGFVSQATAAQGGFQGGGSANSGGFSGPGISISTVQQAVSMRDDSHVILRGNILRHLGKDKYLFKDATGSVNVEIDNDKWQGQTITQDDTVELYGEVDKDWNSVEIDVDKVVKLK